MSNTVLKVENLSKQYRLGTVGSGTLRDDMTRFWARLRGKEDPTLKIGEVNDRTTKGNSDYVWALKDINFEVKQGEILGIIGKNGAGKSTLLKILSKVTGPTTGRVRAKGRIASLLEVGTGFHPELTGRENIYLNGAILGMTKAEIRAKLDEIVDFAGVEKYLDTPVKRYSSGMTVRLGFAVAAHLEPEILIVDEVLAVGDAEFQKKAIGKMQDVSRGEGRTVLFVSHNMAAVQSLCRRGVLLEKGEIVKVGEIKPVVDHYLSKDLKSKSSYITWKIDSRPGDKICELIQVGLVDNNLNFINQAKVSERVGILIEYLVKDLRSFKPEPSLLLSSEIEEKIFHSIGHSVDEIITEGSKKIVCWLPGNLLNDKSYRVKIGITTHNPIKIHASTEIVFRVIDDINAKTRGDYRGEMHGLLRPLLKWENLNVFEKYGA